MRLPPMCSRGVYVLPFTYGGSFMLAAIDSNSDCVVMRPFRTTREQKQLTEAFEEFLDKVDPERKLVAV